MNIIVPINIAGGGGFVLRKLFFNHTQPHFVFENILYGNME